MCRFQREINNKIQEKKALESPADSSSPEASTEVQSSNTGPPCDRNPGPNGKAHLLVGESSSHVEQQCHCGGQSVGNACSVANWAWVCGGQSSYHNHSVVFRHFVWSESVSLSSDVEMYIVCCK